jgi:hypothetical protein
MDAFENLPQLGNDQEINDRLYALTRQWKWLHDKPGPSSFEELATYEQLTLAIARVVTEAVQRGNYRLAKDEQRLE